MFGGLVRGIKHNDYMHLTQAGKALESLVHKNRPAVNRRADRIRGNKKDTDDRSGPLVRREKAVPVIGPLRTKKSLRVTDARQSSRFPPGPQYLRKLQCSPPDSLQVGTARLIAHRQTYQCARQSEKKLLSKAGPSMNIFPAEQDVVLFQNGLNLSLAESFANRAAMLVVDDAARLVQHLPSPLPGEIAQIGIFQVKGSK